MNKFGSLLITILILGIMLIVVVGCSGSSSSSSSSSSYGTRTQTNARDAYDAKYGQGAYDSDSQFLREMERQWDSWTGR